MENISMVEYRSYRNDIVNSVPTGRVMTARFPGMATVIENNPSCIDENLYNYLTWTGLSKEPDFLILSSISRYYYDSGDLKGIRTLINTKELNNINHPDSFLFTIYKLLSSGSYFIGCFNSGRQGDKGSHDLQVMKLKSGLKKAADVKIKKSFTRHEVTRLLEGHGFKVIDFTEIKGIIYFCARIMKRTGE